MDFLSKATVPLLLVLLLSGCHSPRTAASAHPQQPLPREHAAPAEHSASLPKKTSEEVLRGDDAKILVFPECASYPELVPIDELIDLNKNCRVEIVYELGRSLSEGRLQIFNDGEIDSEYPLPELSAGRHITSFTQGFYWKENDETLPDGMLSCNLGTVSTTIGAGSLWSSHSDESVYDYKPGPPGENVGDPPADLAASFRGDDLGFASFNIPGLRNLKAREAGQLPEVEILGVGFVEGTPVECGRGVNLDLGEAPLRDVRVVSTVEHDLDADIPVLKAARFTVPVEVFDYPHHIRIVGKFK